LLEKSYINWAYKELKREVPHERILNDWYVNWKRNLRALNKAHAIFEVAAIVFSKCEFLGSLYAGTINNSNWQDFKLYLDKFFKPEYKKLHKISSSRDINSEIYSVFRNKILHSGQPVGIKDNGQIIGWWMGYGSSLRRNHLKIASNGNLNIHCRILVNDFLESMDKYIKYLKQNKGTLHKKNPATRWKEAFWSTFCPLYYDKKKWMNQLNQLEAKVHK